MRPPAGHPLHLVLGLALWFAWFCAIYGGAAVACAVAPPAAAQGVVTWINAAVLALTVATTAGLAWAAWCTARAVRRMPSGVQTMGTLPGPGDAQASPGGGRTNQGWDGVHPRERFMAKVATALYVTGAVSTLLVGLPAVFVPPCI